MQPKNRKYSKHQLLNIKNAVDSIKLNKMQYWKNLANKKKNGKMNGSAKNIELPMNTIEESPVNENSKIIF